MILPPRQFRWVCLALAIAALGLRLPGLAEKSINIDEIATYQIARDFHFDRIGMRPPLSFVLTAGAVALHDSQAMFLFPAVLFGALAVSLLAWTGRAAFDWRIGLLAGLWLLFSPKHIEYSQYARYYSFMVFFSILSFLYLDLWIRMHRWRYLGFWSLAAAGNLLSHFFAAFVVGLQAGIVGLVLLWWMIQAVAKKRRGWTIAMAIGAGVVLLAGLWAAFTLTGLREMVVQQLTAESKYETEGIHIAWAFWRPYLAELSGWPVGWIPVVLILFGAGLIAAGSRNVLFLVHILFLLLVPIFVVYYAQPKHFFDTQYVSFTLPFFVTTLALGLVGISDGVRRFGRLPATWREPLTSGLLALFVAIACAGFLSFANQPRTREFRDIVRYVDRLARKDDLLLFTVNYEEEFSDDATEFRYFLDQLERGKRGERPEGDSPAGEDPPYQIRVFKRHNVIANAFYRRRLAQPFWHVVSRLHRHHRDELNWAINTLSHQAFEYGFASFGTKHVEMSLDRSVLEPVKVTEPEPDFPAAPDSIDVYRFSIYIPQSGDYYILSNQQVRRGMLRIDGMRPVRWIQLLPRPVSENSKTYIAEGRHDLTLVFPRGEFDKLNDFRLRILPAVGDFYSVNAAQHAYIVPYHSFDYPTMYRGEFGMARREWGVISFPVVLERQAQYEVSLTANNDRPTTNKVGITFDKRPIYTFQFDKRDNSLETKRTKINMPAGIHVLSIQNWWYRGVDEVRRGPIADLRKTTFVSDFTLRYLKDVPDRRR